MVLYDIIILFHVAVCIIEMYQYINQPYDDFYFTSTHTHKQLLSNIREM